MNRKTVRKVISELGRRGIGLFKWLKDWGVKLNQGKGKMK